MMAFSRFHGPVCAGIALLCLAGTAAAQVYRHVDAQGRVSFSDQPPTPAAAARGASAPAGTAPVNTLPTDATLPYELRQIVQRYPVTLYAREGCEPCDAGRNLLITRGIPFSERTVQTPQDNEALQRLSGELSLPLLTLGAQQVKGFQDSEWSQYLTAAGYPASSQLPPGYRRPPATPLVALAPAPLPANAPANAPASAPANAPLPTPAPPAGEAPYNPAGIKF